MSATAKISYGDFEAMVASGDSHPEDHRRFELIEGDLVEMIAANPPHEWSIDVLTEWSFQNLPQNSAWIRVQQSVGIPALDSVPMPDLSWLRRGDFRTNRPQPADVLLIVEVSQTTLSCDRNTKARIDAGAGIEDYWIINLKGQCFEVLREPSPTGYTSRTLVYPGETVRPVCHPDLEFPVSLIFPD